MTVTIRRRDFPGGILDETRVGTKIEVRVSRDTTPGGKVVVGASFEKQEDASIDEEKLLDLGVLRWKKKINDVCPGIELSRKQ